MENIDSDGLSLIYSHPIKVKNGKIGWGITDYAQFREWYFSLTPEKIRTLITYFPFHWDIIKQELDRLIKKEINEKPQKEYKLEILKKEIEAYKKFNWLDGYIKGTQGLHHYVLRRHLEFIKKNPLPIKGDHMALTEDFKKHFKEAFHQKVNSLTDKEAFENLCDQYNVCSYPYLFTGVPIDYLKSMSTSKVDDTFLTLLESTLQEQQGKLPKMGNPSSQRTVALYSESIWEKVKWKGAKMQRDVNLTRAIMQSTLESMGQGDLYDCYSYCDHRPLLSLVVKI